MPAPSPWRFAVCALLLLATTLNYMDRVALNQQADAIKSAFGLSNERYGLVESVFSIAFAMGTLLAGWLVDRGGVRWIYPLAVAGWSLAGFATGFVHSFAMLLVCRLVLGLFEAGNWPCGVRTVRQVMPAEQRSFGNSLFQSGTAIGAIVTPFVILACLKWRGGDDPEVWRWPFTVIGMLGLVWVAAWFLMPRSLLETSVEPPAASSGSYADVLRDRRFYVLIAVIIGVNWGWHTFRIWLPLHLKTTQAFDREAVQRFSIMYYIAADVGAWTVGLFTWLTAKRFFTLHTARMTTFGVCALLVSAGSMLVPFATGSAFTAVTLLVGFGALGLFPTYFALSQELSAAHQGKVTGTLGFLNGLVMAGMSYAQGIVIDSTKSDAAVLATAGVPAVIAFAVTMGAWRQLPSPKTLDPDTSAGE